MKLSPSLLTGFVLALNIVTPVVTLADLEDDLLECSITYSDDSEKCTDDQTDRDDAIWATYNAAFTVEENAYNDTLTSDASTAQSAKNECDQTLASGSAECTKDNYTDPLLDKQADRLADLADCSDEHCMCIVEADFTYDVNKLRRDEHACLLGAQNEHDNKCYTDAVATQSRDDTKAAALFWKNAGPIEGNRTKDLDLSRWAANLCEIAASLTYGSCTLQADCAANPPNCCVDGVGIADNNATLSMSTDYQNTVGNAEAQELYDLIICGYTRMSDDMYSYATYLYNSDQIKATYNKKSMERYNNGYLIGVDNENAIYQQNVDYAACAGNDVTQAAAEQRDAANQANYDEYLAYINGEIWTTRNTELQAEADAVALAYTGHQATETICEKTATDAFQEALDNATEKWNLDAAAADKAYQDGIAACSPQG